MLDILDGLLNFRCDAAYPPHTHTQSEFLDKNNDALHASLEQLISASKDPFINQLFPGATNKGGGNTKKLVLDSVGSKFRVSVGGVGGTM